MPKLKTKVASHKNKNNKEKPANLLKKEYLESFTELEKTIRREQNSCGS